MPNYSGYESDAAELLQGLKRDMSQVSVEVARYAEDQGRAIKSLGARMDEVEQRVARPGGSGGYSSGGGLGGLRGGSLAATVTGHESFRHLINSTGRRGRAMIPVRSGDLAMVTTVTGSAGSMTTIDRRVGTEADIVMQPRRRITIRGLLGSGATTSKSVEYSREDVFTDLAGVVSEGAEKPESDITFEPKQAEVRKIANTITVSSEALADAPALADVVDTTLRYSLSLAEETQLLYGDGTGVNLLGLVPQASAYSAEFTPDLPTDLDTIALALLQSELALLPASGIVLHPTRWRRMLLTKDSEGRYLIGSGPGVASPPQLWGIPVSVTPAITENAFLVGAFALGATLFDREEAHVEISTEHEDYFKRNLALILAEERVALAVKRPAAFVYGTF